MARDLRVIIEVDDKFTKQSLVNLRKNRTEAARAVNKQRQEINKNWATWAQGIADLKAAGFTGLGGPGGAGTGSGRARAKSKKKKKVNPMSPTQVALRKAQRRAQMFQRMASSGRGLAKGAAGAVSSVLGSKMPGAVASAAGVAAKVAAPAAVAIAAYQLAKTANEGLAVLGGFAGSPYLTSISEDLGESFFDQPAKLVAGAQKAATLAVSFSKAKTPLSMEALKGIAEFAYQEEAWRKQRERRDKIQFGEAIGDLVAFMTGFGGG